MDKLSYALGVVIANNLKGLGVNSLATADFSKAIDDILKGEQPEIGETEAQMLVQQFMEQQKSQHKGIDSISLASSVFSEKGSTASVFLLFHYGDKTTEQVVVPMIKRKGVWMMR